MEVTVDGKSAVVEPAGERSLGEVLDEAREKVLGQGRVITEIKLDGGILEAERQEELGSRWAGEFDRVEITTRQATELARETLLELVRHVEQVEAVIPELVGHLEGERVQEAMSLLGACCQMWAVVQEALSRVGTLLSWDYGEENVAGKSVAEWLGEMEGTLRQMNEALVNRDYFLLGEALTYEFSPAMSRWQGILKQLAEDV